MAIKNGQYEAPDVYDDINDFIREYSCEYNDEFEVRWGMDFTYKGKTYHLCRYQMEGAELKKFFLKLLVRIYFNATMR